MSSDFDYKSVLAKFLIRIYYDIGRYKNDKLDKDWRKDPLNKDKIKEILDRVCNFINSPNIESALKDSYLSKEIIEDLLKIMKVFITINSNSSKGDSSSLISRESLKGLQNKKEKAKIFIKALNLHNNLQYYEPFVDFFAIITNSSLRGKYYAYLLSEYNKLQMGGVNGE